VIDGKRDKTYSINPFAYEMHESRVEYKKVEREKRLKYETEHFEKYGDRGQEGDEELP